MAEDGGAYPGLQEDSDRTVMAIEIQPSHVSSALTSSTIQQNARGGDRVLRP
jgi:hypothetical protein